MRMISFSLHSMNNIFWLVMIIAYKSLMEEAESIFEVIELIGQIIDCVVRFVIHSFEAAH